MQCDATSCLSLGCITQHCCGTWAVLLALGLLLHALRAPRLPPCACTQQLILPVAPAARAGVSNLAKPLHKAVAQQLQAAGMVEAATCFLGGPMAAVAGGAAGGAAGHRLLYVRSCWVPSAMCNVEPRACTVLRPLMLHLL